MALEPRYKKITEKMQEEGKVSFAKIENLDYYHKFQKAKDTEVSDLKKRGIIRGVFIEEYSHKVF